jgi:hypothetical protein
MQQCQSTLRRSAGNASWAMGGSSAAAGHVVHDAFQVTDEERVVTRQETVEGTSRNWARTQATNRNCALPEDPRRMSAKA